MIERTLKPDCHRRQRDAVDFLHVVLELLPNGDAAGLGSSTGRAGSRRDRLRGRKGRREEAGGGSGDGGSGRREGRGLDSYKSAGASDRPVIYVTMALTMGSGPAVFH